MSITFDRCSSLRHVATAVVLSALASATMIADSAVVRGRPWNPSAAAIARAFDATPIPGGGTMPGGPGAAYAAGAAGGGASSCGGPYERACCFLENTSIGACGSDTIEVAGCTGDCQCGGAAAPGVNASSTCYPKTCGGDGQRACALDERSAGHPGACDFGLSEIPGCSGDCQGFGPNRLASSSMCIGNVNARIAEPTTNRLSAQANACAVSGYADLHMHLFADTAHGGGILAGEAYDPHGGGVNVALRPDYGTTKDLVDFNGVNQASMNPGICPNGLSECGTNFFHKDHLLDDPVGSVGTNDSAGSNFGTPIFNGWPRWTSTTHQQAYFTWLKRAFEGGLRLTTMLAVTNSALCKGNKRLRGFDCADSMHEIDNQIQSAKKFETWIDAHDGGWFKIVYSPLEARTAIADGKLAVVLGIEVDNLFNCAFPLDQTTRNYHDTLGAPGIVTGWNFFTDQLNAACNPTELSARLDHYYYDLGIRHVFPIHNFDNAYGAPATWMSGIEFGNRASENHWWVTENCPADYGFKSKVGSFGNLASWLTRFLAAFPFQEFIDVDGIRYNDTTTCNRWGLFPLGVDLINGLMDRGMIIDVDHMSIKAFDSTLDMAEARHYPVVATHVLSYDMHIQNDRHERMRTRAQLERIRDGGGMIAAMLKDDVQDTGRQHDKVTVPYGGVIADDCQQSSKSFAQAYQYAVDVMRGPVAFGSDFNGVAAHVGPRFGSDGCGGIESIIAPDRIAQRDAQYTTSGRQRFMKNPLVYPFTIDGFGTFDKQVTGMRSFDFNVDGMAHVGMLPDFVAELKTIGLPEVYTDSIMQSAEQYIRVWEKSLGQSTLPSTAPSAQTGGASCPLIGSILANPEPFRAKVPIAFSQAGIAAAGITSYSWDFGDGTSGIGAAPQHTYAHGGSYTVSLNVSGRVAYSVASRTISVFEGTPPAGLLTGPALMNETENGHFNIQGYATDNDVVSIASITCGVGAATHVSANYLSSPNIGVTFDCSFAPGNVTMNVSVTLRDFDGDRVESLVVVNNSPPRVNLFGPTRSSVGDVPRFFFTASAADHGTLTLLPASCGPAGQIASGPGIQFSGQGLPTLYYMNCHFTAASASNPISVAFSDDTGKVSVATLDVLVGRPPEGLLGLLGGDSAVNEGDVGHFFVQGYSTEGDQVSVANISCGSSAPVSQRQGGIPAPNVEVDFDCRLDTATTITATLRDFDGDKVVQKLVTVKNVGPTITTLNGPVRFLQHVIQGQTLPITVAASDPGPHDVLTARVHWSDRPFDTVRQLNGATQIDHTWHAAGPVTVTVTVVDKDGAVSAPRTITVDVVKAGPQITFDQVVDHIGTGTGPHAMATDTRGRVFIANAGANTVSVVDGATQAVIGTIAVNDPRAIAVDSTYNVLFVASGTDWMVHVIDASSFEDVSSFFLSGTPQSMATEPNGGALYVTTRQQDLLEIFHFWVEQGRADLTGPNPVWIPARIHYQGDDSHAAGPDPAGVMIGNNGDVWVANESLGDASGSISIFNQSGQSLERQYVDARPTAIGQEPDSGIVYVVNTGSKTVWAMNPYYHYTQNVIDVGDGPSAIGFSPMSGDYYDPVVGGWVYKPSIRRAYVTNSLSGTVSVFETTQDRVLATVPVGGSPSAIVGGDPTHLLVANETDQVSVLEESTDALMTVLATSADGAVVDYVVVANDPVEGQQYPYCEPGSGGQFAVGTTTVTCEIFTGFDEFESPVTSTLRVSVVSTLPVITVPGPIVAEATGPNGATVMFSPTAHDPDGSVLPVTCAPASGSTFPLAATRVDCTAAGASGQLATGSFSVTVLDTTPPTIAAAVSPDANPAGWRNDVTTVRWTVTDVVGVTQSTGCSTVTLTQDTAGSVLTCTAQDAAGNSASQSVPIRLDRTAPAITFMAVSPAANENGWHKTNVTVPFTITDLGSGLPAGAQTGGTLTFSVEGAGLTRTVTAFDVAGNQATVTSPAINLDTTPPSITGARAPAANTNGWNNTDVTATFTCDDGLSGVAFCTSPTTLTGEGTGQSRAGVARDLAGNEATTTIGGINIDKTPPAVTVPANITKEATGPGGAAATFAASASDVVTQGLTPTCSASSGATFGLGTTTVTCSATDGAGNSASASFTVNVVDTTAPVLTVPAPISVHATGPAGAAVAFTVSASDIVDGTDPVTCSASSGATFPRGTTTVTCSAIDRHNNSRSGGFSITVTNSAPSGVNDSYSGQWNTPLVVAASGALKNDTDQDGDPLSAILVTGPAHGTLTLDANGGFTYLPAANASGTDSFTYRPNDGREDGSIATVSIAIATNCPGDRDERYRWRDRDYRHDHRGDDDQDDRGDRNDYDRDDCRPGTPIAKSDFYMTNHDAPLSVAAKGVLRNDGGLAVTAVLVSNPSHGTLALNSDGGFVYAPASGFSGKDTFVYAARSANGTTGPVAIVTIRVRPNIAPDADNDYYTTKRNTTLTVNAAHGVLVGDSDANGDPLTAQLASGPTHGTITLGADGSFVYKPATGYTGADAFTYTLRDPGGLTDTATVTLRVVSRAQDDDRGDGRHDRKTFDRDNDHDHHRNGHFDGDECERDRSGSR